jgi:hypothetical protein
LTLFLQHCTSEDINLLAVLRVAIAPSDSTFGWSVSTSGDTIVVGARLEDSNATGVNGTQSTNAGDSGATYVFVRDGTTWIHKPISKPVILNLKLGLAIQ